MVACNGETRGDRRVEAAVANEADLVIVLLDIARSAEPCSTRHYWFYIVKHFSLIARASLTTLLPASAWDDATFPSPAIYILVQVPIPNRLEFFLFHPRFCRYSNGPVDWRLAFNGRWLKGLRVFTFYRGCTFSFLLFEFQGCYTFSNSIAILNDVGRFSYFFFTYFSRSFNIPRKFRWKRMRVSILLSFIFFQNSLVQRFFRKKSLPKVSLIIRVVNSWLSARKIDIDRTIQGRHEYRSTAFSIANRGASRYFSCLRLGSARPFNMDICKVMRLLSVRDETSRSFDLSCY